MELFVCLLTCLFVPSFIHLFQCKLGYVQFDTGSRNKLYLLPTYAHIDIIIFRYHSTGQYHMCFSYP